MPDTSRMQFGIPELDECLGGGLLPGTLTVVLGATGIGKTQLGLHFAHHGMSREGRQGIILDLTSRGDPQNHADYSSRLFEWHLRERSSSERFLPTDVWNENLARADYLHLFRHSGRRVTQDSMDPDQWREWKIELSRKLEAAIAFMYGNFIYGVRRLVVDGIEPVDRAHDSFQLQTFEYVYHQILRKESDWVARDLFRARFLANSEQVDRHGYNYSDLGCLLLCTTHEVMLDDLVTRPIESGDVLSNANTIILLGKTRAGSRMGRALHVAKHRGSACDDSIIPFKVAEKGLVFERT